MTTLYLTEPYSTVRKDGDTLVIKIPARREGAEGTRASSGARGKPGGAGARASGRQALVSRKRKTAATPAERGDARCGCR